MEDSGEGGVVMGTSLAASRVSSTALAALAALISRQQGIEQSGAGAGAAEDIITMSFFYWFLEKKVVLSHCLTKNI